MSNLNRTGANTPDFWEYYRIGFKAGIGVGVAANATATIPILNGGVTANVGGNYIIRRITARNSSGTIAAANLSISGPISGQIVNSQGMSAVSAVDMYQDFTLVATFTNPANVAVSVTVPPTTTMFQDEFLYLNVQGAAAANNTIDIAVFGEMVNG